MPVARETRQAFRVKAGLGYHLEKGSCSVCSVHRPVLETQPCPGPRTEPREGLHGSFLLCVSRETHLRPPPLSPGAAALAGLSGSTGRGERALWGRESPPSTCVCAETDPRPQGHHCSARPVLRQEPGPTVAKVSSKSSRLLSAAAKL